jgi:ABC-type multidrug transport system ATPase subunit
MITLEAVTKRYGDKRAVDDVSIHVARGQSMALWGSNGAGKTTVIRCLLGATRYEGEIRVDGLSPYIRGKAVRRNIGYVPQTMPIFDMNVGDMVHLIARLRGAGAQDGVRLLDEFGLSHTRRQSVASLSGGMRQKLALTLALLGDPQVLLFDEPTANLDAKSQAELIIMLSELKQQGRTIIFTSHRWSEVRALADTVVILEMGKQIGGGDVADLIADADRVSLRVELPEAQAVMAQSMLTARGFLVSRNGNALLVSIESRRKVEPMLALAREGYEIGNFDLEDEG